MTLRFDKDLSRHQSRNGLEIGLVNNMPDTALEATERQFCRLLEAASGGIPIRLTFYALPEVPRSDRGQRHVESYSSLDNLLENPPDGLIVTGMEPRSADLRQEPYWTRMAQLVEWAECNTTSTVWSCLAAHAAVLHMDGIQRRRLHEKRFGVFECARVADHPLSVGVPARLRMPHSRWNELPEAELRSAGYCIVTHSDDAGADAFVKQGKNLFVFFQGHPEYESDTLLLEYKRDIKRFLKRESDIYPSMPIGYFDDDTMAAWTTIQRRALSDRHEGIINDFPALRKGEAVWHQLAMRTYRNWLFYLIAHRKQRFAQLSESTFSRATVSSSVTTSYRK